MTGDWARWDEGNGAHWQPPGSRVYFNNNEVIAIRQRPREVLRVRVSEVAWVEYALASEGVFKLSGTHEDVKAWVVRNLPSVTGCREAVLVGTEVEASPAGVIDVLARGCGKAFVIEVKRGVVDLNAVSQLKRYVDAVGNSIGVLVGSWFTSGARGLARELGFRTVTYE
jgi:RecB family endonuclease NucS